MMRSSINFRSISNLESAIWANLHRFPEDVEIVVGVPRSGLMAASHVALALNLPFVDVDGFVEGRVFQSGQTRPVRVVTAARRTRVLLVDDSIRTGTSMQVARARLDAIGPGIEVVTCAVYATPEAAGLVDLPLEILPTPRVFQWNVMHHPVLNRACVDMDGVLCADPTAEENDDGPRYETFLREARPLHLTAQRIGAIVTSRLERYRRPTEDWLARHGVQYDRLVMLDLPDAAARRRAGVHGRFKGEYFQDSKAELFVESERSQAIEISRISGKPALWITGPTLFQPDPDPDRMIHEATARVRRAGTLQVKSLLRRTLGPRSYDQVRLLLRQVRHTG